jgi:hypothetical protein
MITYASLKGKVITVAGDPQRWSVAAPGVDLSPVRSVAFDFAIIEDGGGHFQLAYNAVDAEFAGDTWHETIEEAYENAEATFGIRQNEWVRLQ